jgi:hypothetical protein
MDTHDETDSIAFFQIHAGDGDRADVISDFNEQRIAVSVFPDSGAGELEQASIQNDFIHHLDRTQSGDLDDSEYEELLDDIAELS